MFNKGNSTRQRHCMIVHAYYPLGETRVEREALALVDAGFEVDVICLGKQHEASFETIGGVDIYRLPVVRNKKGGFLKQILEYLKFFLLVFFKLLVLFPRRRYKTVQSHNPPDFLIFSALIPKIFGARLILDLHDLMPEFFAYKKDLDMDSLLVRLVVVQERLSCWIADHVITVTDIWRDRLISRGVREDKISVVMNVADDRIFYPDPDNKNGREDDHALRLIYHGTITHHYGMEDLIKAIRLASEKIPDIYLTLQGRGEYLDDTVRLVDELGVQQNVHINAVMLPTEELPALIRQADAGVVPNQNDVFTGDLLPTKMLEYIALDVPVIAAKTRVISQYFDESMVQFFTPGDAESLAQNIVYLYRHRERLKEQSVNSKKFADAYSWRSVSKKYVDLIDRLRKS